jgi:hypothetical protein
MPPALALPARIDAACAGAASEGVRSAGPVGWARPWRAGSGATAAAAMVRTVGLEP